MRISKWVILITLCLTIFVAAITVYANNVGNFIISISNTDGGSLMLSESSDFENGNVILFGPSVEGLTNATYINIPKYGLMDNDGDHSDNRGKTYLAYSFYLKNIAPVPVDYQMTLDINEVFRNVDSAIRIEVIRGESDGEAGWKAVSDNIYAKREKDGTMYDNSKVSDLNPRPYTTAPFYNDSTPAVQVEEQFGVDSVCKYVVIMWVEGNDPDCVDSLLSGMIRVSLSFKVTSIY